MAVELGARARDARRKEQLLDRRAAAYASNLIRQCARLIGQLPDSVPVLRPAPGSSASALRHHVVRHDLFTDPPRVRLLVVSSDGRLRTCTVIDDGSARRLWEYYDVQDPPAGLEIEVVFSALTALIVKLESSVSDVESRQHLRERQVSGAIADSSAALTISAAQHAAHGETSRARQPFTPDPAPDADPRSVVEDLFGDVQTPGAPSGSSSPSEAATNDAPEPSHPSVEPATNRERKWRPFRFSRIHKAV